MIVRLTSEFAFEMAHALSRYEGPCRHIHGHSYKLWVTVKGKISDTRGSAEGMVMDFKQLKSIVRQAVVDPFDHALVLPAEIDDSDKKTMEKWAGKLILLSQQPTAEHLVTEFVNRIRESLPDDVNLHSLKLAETATAFAEWYAEDN